ncbi:MAG: NAD(P)H-dependent oxidoreductase [Candidatus Onthovivens sp.]|nr:NAD(P)H-dependent oxidoreductase [Candidatus Onthovivens sp.]
MQKDNQNELLDKFIEADIVLFSIPLYCYSMPSYLKTFVDRIIPLAKQNMKIEKNHVEHDNLVDFMNKRILVISGAGFPQFEDNFLGLKIQLRN